MLRHLASDELIFMVRGGLEASMAEAARAGIKPEATVLDPGYGFGKRYDENYELLDRQAELLTLGRPLLAGLSRKSFLGRTLAPLYTGQQAKSEWGATAPVDARETASIAALVAAILHGAAIVRVHAVRPAVEAALIADAIVAAG
jgi:dihydropteroate synthase